ncbi:MAG: hypothetical protein HUU01_13560 [Saprospiraceae bacterium]|nr:hypothetical protein [Saprospiraceae bacterium]
MSNIQATIANNTTSVANTAIIIDQFKKFDQTTDWFFTQNRNLKYAILRPSNFPEENNSIFWAWWNKITEGQRRILARIAQKNLPENVNSDDYHSIKKAIHYWQNGFYGVIYNTGHTSCNLFVGEVMYKSGFSGNTIMNAECKYFSANEIKHQKGGYKKIGFEELMPGDVVVLNNGKHVEIVIEVHKNENKYISIGAGRTGSQNENTPNGTKKDRTFTSATEFRRIGNIEFIGPPKPIV